MDFNTIQFYYSYLYFQNVWVSSIIITKHNFQKKKKENLEE